MSKYTIICKAWKSNTGEVVSSSQGSRHLIFQDGKEPNSVAQKAARRSE